VGAEAGTKSATVSFIATRRSNGNQEIDLVAGHVQGIKTGARQAHHQITIASEYA
jgi:hypothetical protein